MLHIPRGNGGAQEACTLWITLIQAGLHNGIAGRTGHLMADWEEWLCY